MIELMKNFAIFTIALVVCVSGSFSNEVESIDVQSQWTWYPQKTHTKKFNFFVQAENTDANQYAVHSIRIINKITQIVVQEIHSVDGMGVQRNPNELVTVVDANFDGSPVLVVPFADGGAGPNSMNNYYLFNLKKNRFEFNKQLSELPQSSIDSNGKVTSMYRDGCCHHHTETYRLRNGRLILIADWDEAFTADGWIETSTGMLVDRKWKSKTTRIKQEDRKD